MLHAVVGRAELIEVSELLLAQPAVEMTHGGLAQARTLACVRLEPPGQVAHNQIMQIVKFLLLFFDSSVPFQ